MNVELENKLVKDHWILSNSVQVDRYTLPFPMFGIECDDGWYNLLDELCSRIEDKLDKEVDEFFVDQVKEKYGGLRFYVSSATEEILDLIDEYEEKSYTICESCGKSGKLVNHFGWYKTVCEDCEEKWISIS